MSDNVHDFLQDLARAARPRRPSQRNQMIHASIRFAGRDQSEVAAEFGISQPRVSVIVRQVERWRRLHTPAELDEPHGAERQRLERWLARQRYETLYAHALRFLEHSQRDLMTMSDQWKEGSHNASDQTRRSQRAEAQWMRIALQATKEMVELGEWDEPQEDANTERLGAVAGVVQLLTRVREAAVREGRVADEGQAQEAVERVLRQLVGAEPTAAKQDAASNKCYTPEQQTDSAKPALEVLASDASDEQAASCDAIDSEPAKSNGQPGVGATAANITVGSDERCACHSHVPRSVAAQNGVVVANQNGAAKNREMIPARPVPRAYRDFVTPPGEARIPGLVPVKNGSAGASPSRAPSPESRTPVPTSPQSSSRRPDRNSHPTASAAPCGTGNSS